MVIVKTKGSHGIFYGGLLVAFATSGSCSVDVKVYDGSSKDESSLLKAVTNVHTIIDKEIAGEINPENVYICGFSQGGALTLASVLLYPKALGGGSVFSGWIPFNIWSYGSNNGCRALGIKRQHCTQETETPRSVQDLTTSSKLLTLYAGDLVSSLGLFGELKDKDVIVWNTVGLFVEMIQKGYEFDSTTLLLAASALSTLHLSKKFPMVHCLAIETSLVSDSSLCNALMILYAKGEDLSSTEYGYPRKSLKYFKSMTGSGQEADSVTFSCVISACSSLEKLPLGEPLHGLVIKSGYSPEAEEMQSVDKIQPDIATVVSITSICGDFCLSREGRAVHGYTVRWEMQSRALEGPYFSIPAVRVDIGNKGSHILELCYRWLRIKWSPFRIFESVSSNEYFYQNNFLAFAFCI
ncbi:hypothetical protein ARALYDRAFT_354574 [Arabidopsis lyrata subsp. lyrata]|uniref:Phospholipase/carboxylesterase/thioesterase domain-containing protein n=1 Tax=Arabidopsis lyrata subsp. lyrata TaxID=81972 RepID=D7MEB1_ARALL|nr:hypothetical protein ARALYDRAFT_354574 [Arabidopsis lyrata subsp. lyrata]